MFTALIHERRSLPDGHRVFYLKARPSGDEWFVYMVQCADGSLYTGTAKDVARRCQLYNDGTASRYTRSRLPVELIYHEAHPSRSSALKREAAIKVMGRREKLEMAQRRKRPAKGVRQVARLEDVPFTFNLAMTKPVRLQETPAETIDLLGPPW